METILEIVLLKLFSCFWREQYSKVVANYGAGHAPFKLYQVLSAYMIQAMLLSLKATKKGIKIGSDFIWLEERLV